MHAMSMIRLDQVRIESFCQHIWHFYAEHGREFAWRYAQDPYQVLVSEIMLQQTQTDRVKEKYEQFLAAFGTFQSLADASLRDVLSVWQGLGYNRRGKYLHEIAQKVINEYGGLLPRDPEILITFPGIGTGTAGSICAFAFNIPTIFIETNIRTVFIHTFFNKKDQVTDQKLMPLIAATVDQRDPRSWYYALMDYGVYLKKLYKNPSRKSAHYTKQSQFKGSDRQMRGKIIKILTQESPMTEEQLLAILDCEALRLKKIIEQLTAEQMITRINNLFLIQ
jgi:A/G-specific adenine glycosylase